MKPQSMKPQSLMFSREIYELFKEQKQPPQMFYKKTYNFINKRLQHMYFPVKTAKLFRALILKNICERQVSSSF